MRKAQKTMVVIPNARLAYMNVWEPKKLMNGTRKYSCEVIFPMSDTETVEKIHAAMGAAYEEYGDRVPDTYRDGEVISPLKIGSQERPRDSEYEGMYFMRASSMNAPGIVYTNLKPIINRAEVYSGIYAKVSVSFYLYYKIGRDGRPVKGVACSLRNIMKLSDGKPLGKRDTPEDDFAEDRK